jgi:lipopolysaccharide export system permease protein
MPDMLAIFDRYLLASFFRVWLVAFCCFAGLYVVVDLFNHLDDLLVQGEQSEGVFFLLCSYYGPRLLVLAERTSAVLSLVAALFVLSWLQRTNELTAVEAAGVTRWRVVRPLLAASVVVSFVTIANRELVIPRYQQQLVRSAQDWSPQSWQPIIPQYDSSTDVYLQGRAANLAEQRIDKPLIRLPPALAAWGRQLQADEAIYEQATADHPSGYRLRGVKIPEDIATRSNVTVGGRIILYAPAETPWLQPDECFVVSQLEIEHLVAGDARRRYGATAELIADLQRGGVDYGADVRVAVHSRLLQPVLDVLLFFTGLPVVFVRRTASVYVAIGHAMLLVAGYMSIVLAAQTLGNHYLLSPALAAWAPVLVFTPVAYWSAASALAIGGGKSLRRA